MINVAPEEALIDSMGDEYRARKASLVRHWERDLDRRRRSPWARGVPTPRIEEMAHDDYARCTRNLAAAAIRDLGLAASGTGHVRHEC